MKLMSLFIITFFVFTSYAEVKVKMYFNNEEITKMIEIYSKTSGQKFIIDPAVRGKASIFLQDEVSIEEAFNHLSSALAINGYAISKQGDTMVIKTARNIQRDLIEVSTERPNLKPERMYTWIYTVKNIPAQNITKDLRILPSKDGEMSVNSSNNQLIFTDWTSNLNRIADIMKELDKIPTPEIAKIIDSTKKDKNSKKATNKTTE